MRILPDDQLIRIVILSTFAWGLVWSVAAVLLRNRLSRQEMWVTWFVTVNLATSILTYRVAGSFPDLRTPWVTWFYMGFALIGVPSAAALVAANPTGRGGHKRPAILRIGYAILAFVVALPVGAVLAALPDFVVFMSK